MNDYYKFNNGNKRREVVGRMRVVSNLGKAQM